MPPELKKICAAWAKNMEDLGTPPSRISFIEMNLPKLLLNRSLFERLLEGISSGNSYPDIRHTDAFDNEILLYLHPGRIFSIRFFLFGPGDFTPIHDHNSWGVTGTALNELTVIKYKREDDGSVENHARLHETERRNLVPGETELTLPLDEGIHQTGNETRDPVIMVSVYGSPIRRLYVRGFDLNKQQVYNMYAPRMKKKLLARQILDHLEKTTGSV
jgi:predicted metal-dependent enzyme (double-stranded beta helix superfamily)